LNLFNISFVCKTHFFGVAIKISSNSFVNKNFSTVCIIIGLPSSSKNCLGNGTFPILEPIPPAKIPAYLILFSPFGFTILSFDYLYTRILCNPNNKYFIIDNDRNETMKKLLNILLISSLFAILLQNFYLITNKKTSIVIYL